MADGYVLYEGPSQLDGFPIVMIGTGFASASENRKTGWMVQTWILRRDIKPTEAVKNGDDRSVCGDCRFRGEAGKGRSCYVNVGQAPNMVWAAYHRDAYPRLCELRLLRRRAIRIGSYGDPAAVPTPVVAALAGAADGHTGYTHQWRTCDQRLREWCMASADSEQDYLDAKDLGWRVFRVRPLGADDRFACEAVCPASAEAGYKIKCDECLACCGTSGGRRGDIVISVHGSGAVTASHQRTFRGIPIRRAA